jgi:hypothetical protein
LFGLVMILTCLAGAAARAEVTRSSLRDVSLTIMALYNAGDGIGLYARLSEPLALRYSAATLTETLSECRERLGSLTRLSLPVASNATSGMFAAYFETGTRDMYLELDEQGLIRLVSFAGAEDNCSLVQPE